VEIFLRWPVNLRRPDKSLEVRRTFDAGESLARAWLPGLYGLVQDVFAQPMVGGQGGVSESPLADHANADHYFFGGVVVDGGKRVDFVHIPAVEAGMQACRGSFGGQAAAPIVGGYAPADFYAGSGRLMILRFGSYRQVLALKARVREADEADEGACFFPLRGEQSITLLVDIFFDGNNMGF
jgi:hypothetical protein